MLLNLYVKNFAIIKEINIDFNNGLNIISGETGSGKSILLKALSLLKGERFSKDYLGVFDNRTVVEAVFKSNDKINNFLEESGLDYDDNIILSRQFTETTSITKINNRACNIKTLGEVSNLLFDIHGQHSSLVALDKSNYINMIDNFNTKAFEIRENLKDNLSKLNKLYDSKKKLDLSEDEVEREKDLLKYQINEIESFDFTTYDEEKLNNEYKKLSNQKDLIEGTQDILDLMIEGNRKLSLLDSSTLLYDKLRNLSRFDDYLNELESEALNIRELINDLSKSVENYAQSLEIDDERIQIIEEQFASFQVLKLKYGKDVDEILSYLDKNHERLKVIDNIDATIKKIDKDISEINKENLSLAVELTNIRSAIASELENRIIDELNEMNMQHIDFKISIKNKDKISKDGIDDIDFLISTNKGQELKSLSQVSSGGEISRFMLAMKAVLSEKEDINTIIFDEIDTGISGKTADIVGDKLKKISKSVQLIVISHLAQIASKSDYHYLITKDIDQDYSISNVKELDQDGKVNEIARLISGSDITDRSISSAKELLEVKHDG